jgi:GNAT superfamily N-acetyltransferase
MCPRNSALLPARDRDRACRCRRAAWPSPRVDNADYYGCRRESRHLRSGYAFVIRSAAIDSTYTLISERDGHIDGYVRFIALDEGFVRDLVVSPTSRHGGVGRELMDAAAGVLRARGIAEWTMDVRADNTPAIDLYEQLGMCIEHRSTVVRVPVARIPELPRERAQALPIDPAEEDDIERALGLLAGRVAMARVRAHSAYNGALIQLRDRHCAAVGFGAIGPGHASDPTLPAVTPFRVARPELAGTLLTSLAAHTASAIIHVVLEDDPGVSRLLAGIGAETVLDLLHYRGPLPRES